jgi:hypothetical protein
MEILFETKIGKLKAVSGRACQGRVKQSFLNGYGYRVSKWDFSLHLKFDPYP